MKQYQIFMEKTAKKAGKAVLRRFGHAEITRTKANITDFVTKSDLIANDIISDAIKAKYPKHGIISEEQDGHQADAEYTWFVDPIDGTNNFATGIPLFGVMVALKHKRSIVMSGIYLPVFDEYYFAQKGKGAFLNGKPIHCTKKIDWPETFGCGNARMSYPKMHIVKAFLRALKQHPYRLSRFGSAAVGAAYVASGRRDWLLLSGGGYWDYAPISLLLKESGCKISDLKGNPWTVNDLEILAANKPLHKSLLNLF